MSTNALAVAAGAAFSSVGNANPIAHVRTITQAAKPVEAIPLIKRVKVVRVSGTINVSAASSLTAPFTEIAKSFEKVNPKAHVVVNFAGSSALATQIKNGSPADVFASADTANMNKLVEAKLIDHSPAIFAKNTLIIVVPTGNPKGIRTLGDLARDDLFVGLGAVGVPVGDYARQVLAAAGVTVTPKTLESNVSAVVAKIALREIDAGIVYVTDVTVNDNRVDGVAIPADVNVIASYPIGVVASSKNKLGASKFLEFVRTASGQAILRKYKFLSPS